MPLKKEKKNYNATENLILFSLSLTIEYITMNSHRRLQYLKKLHRLLRLFLFLLPIFRVLFLITEKNILFFQKKKKKKINEYIQEEKRRNKVVVWKKRRRYKSSKGSRIPDGLVSTCHREEDTEERGARVTSDGHALYGKSWTGARQSLKVQRNDSRTMHGLVERTGQVRRASDASNQGSSNRATLSADGQDKGLR